MKKVSIGLFALLGIVFAATSAFTAKVPVTDRFEMWVFDQGFVDYPSSTSPSGQYTELSSESKTPIASDDQETIAQFLSSNLASCVSDEDRICVAKVDNNLSPAQVLEIEDGAYTPE